MTASTMIFASVQQQPDFRDLPGQRFGPTSEMSHSNNSSSNDNNSDGDSLGQTRHTSCPLFTQQQQQQTRQTSFASWYTSSDDDDEDDEGILSAIHRSLSNLSECLEDQPEAERANTCTSTTRQRRRASSHDNLLSEHQDFSKGSSCVRFSEDPPQVFSYEQPSLQYYCHLYYGAHEMQELINEYMKEQQQQQQNEKPKVVKEEEELAETSTSSSSWEDVTESCCSRGKIRFSQEPDQVHEYEKPQNEEYDLLYYSSDEVDQMIDDYYLKEWVYCPKVECPSNSLQAATLQQQGAKAD